MKKNVVIGVLIVIILIMGGTLIYLTMNKDKINVNYEVNDKKSEGKSENNKTTDSNNSSVNVQSCGKYIDATFYGENVGNGFSFKETITLKSDGTFVDTYENAGGIPAGTYEIDNGKIIFTYPGDEMNEAHTSINNISDDCKIITRDSGDVKTLNRSN